MAAQPDVQVINNAIAQLTGEIAKFPNIPTIANGNAILDAINGLENRLVARMRASWVQIAVLSYLNSPGCAM
jgi:hypothetical protein